MHTYTQEQRNALIAELSVAAGLLSVGQVRDWDDLSETLKCAAHMLAAPSTSREVDMPTEAEVEMDSFSRITEQTVRGDQLQALAIDYAALCGELSKGLSPLDKEWIDLRDLGERLDELADHNFKRGA